jgi:DNA-binding CsgD family transcriptional regulator/ArsR family metal-binding transcriptional regulator
MSSAQICIEEGKKVFLSGYKNLSVKRAGILTCPRPKLGVLFEVEQDMCPLFPYINASLEGAKYFDSPQRIQFIFNGAKCTLYSHEIIAAAFKDYDDALLFSDNLICYLNGLYEKRADIKPNYKTIEPLSALDLYRLLPKSNCKKCGFPSCLAFAAAQSKGKTSSVECPEFPSPIAEKAVYPIFNRQGNLSSTVELAIPDPQPEITVPENLLTGRELQVLRLLANGASNPEISESLSISPHTVKTHVTHIYDKLGIHDRAQAAVWASRHNIV